MPYFIFRITNEKKPELLEAKDKFMEAKTVVRELRQAIEAGGSENIRMMFAGKEQEARRLLRTKHEPSPVEEWEK